MIEPDERNILPEEYLYFSDDLPMGSKVRITFEVIEPEEYLYFSDDLPMGSKVRICLWGLRNANGDHAQYLLDKENGVEE